MQLAIINRKGGVGKSTTAINLAAAFAGAKDLGIAEKNFRTLLVDLDSQANSSTALGVPFNDLSPSIAELLLGEVSPADAIRDTSIENLYLVTASDRIAHEEKTFLLNEGTEHRLKELMKVLRQPFDMVVFDCPPARGVIFTMSMIAADAFLIPLPVAHFSKEGITSLFQAYGEHRNEYPDSAGLLGIVLTMMDYFPAYRQAEREQELRATYGDAIFETVIPRNKHLDDAQGAQQTIFQFKADSSGAEGYRVLAQEVIERARHYMFLPEAESVEDVESSAVEPVA